MEKLNAFETAILERFAGKYEYLRNHIPFLKVKNREYTGVGMYINFTYTNMVESLEINDTCLGTDEMISVESLINGLFFELAITDGRIDFIELVTLDEDWDVVVDNFSFVPMN